jgi:hypothetical protein
MWYLKGSKSTNTNSRNSAFTSSNPEGGMNPSRLRPFLSLSLPVLLLVLGAVPGRADGIRRTIDAMSFRAVPEDDPLLGQRFKQKEALYSIRPPAGWVQKPSRMDNPRYKYPVQFTNPENGDSLSIGLIEGGPQDLTIESLSRFRGDYLGAFRKTGLGKILGSDLYRFGRYTCVQGIFLRNQQLTLQLLVFSQPGSFLQLAFQTKISRYHSLARMIEACIASLEWPYLR